MVHKEHCVYACRLSPTITPVDVVSGNDDSDTASTQLCESNPFIYLLFVSKKATKWSFNFLHLHLMPEERLECFNFWENYVK